MEDPKYLTSPCSDKIQELLIPFFSKETRPTQNNLMSICMGFLTLDCCPSIRKLFEHYLFQATGKTLDTFYKLLAKAKLARPHWESCLIEAALGIIDDSLKEYPIFIIVDDTLVKKQGTKFEHVGRLYDHTAKAGEPRFINGHCFVTLQICVPTLLQKGEVKYFAVPVSHVMWKHDAQDRQSKLDIAFKRISGIIAKIRKRMPSTKIGVLCDSWYPKGSMVTLAKEKDVFFIANVRWDTQLFDFPVQHSGSRRLAKRGKKIYIEDLELKHVPGTKYSIAHMAALSPLFPDCTLDVFVSAPTDDEINGRKVFICTDSSALDGLSGIRFEGDAKHFMKYAPEYLPFALYSLRWNIEVAFLELKSFWGMEDYMLRVGDSIETYVNLQLIVYSLMKMLPLLDPAFSHLEGRSPQDRRFAVGKIQKLLDVVHVLLLESQKPQSLRETPLQFLERVARESNLLAL